MLNRLRVTAGPVVVLTMLSSALVGAPANAATATDVPANVSPPTISGTPQAGETLTEGHGSWTNQPTGYGYHWARCNSAGTGCAAIAGATGRIYTLTAADVGHAMVVAEVARNAAGERRGMSMRRTALPDAGASAAAAHMFSKTVSEGNTCAT